jgi:hypothetical protein
MLLLLAGLMAGSVSACSIPGLFLAAGNAGDATAAASTDKTPSTSDNAQTADPSEEQLTWSGTILSVDQSGRGFLAAVDKQDQSILGDKAHVALYADAEIVHAGTGAPYDLKQAPVGSKVTVTISGGIRESYPVQTSAVRVEVTP